MELSLFCLVKSYVEEVAGSVSFAKWEEIAVVSFCEHEKDCFSIYGTLLLLTSLKSSACFPARNNVNISRCSGVRTPDVSSALFGCTYTIHWTLPW